MRVEKEIWKLRVEKERLRSESKSEQATSKQPEAKAQQIFQGQKSVKERKRLTVAGTPVVRGGTISFRSTTDNGKHEQIE